MATQSACCIECRQAGRVPRRRCPDCRDPVHQRCQIGHACARKQARVAALAAEAEAWLMGYRVVLTLEVDSARGSPDSWEWPSRLGLRAPERVVADVTRAHQRMAIPTDSHG
jgi:hypothetical protein